MTTTENPMLASLQPFFSACERNIQKYNLVLAQVQAAEGDRDAAIQAWMDGSEDEEATAIRNAIKQAEAKLRSLAEVAVGDDEVTPEEKAKLRTELETTEKKLKSASRALRNLAEPFDIDVNPILQKMGDPFLPKQSTGTGSGLPRPSVYVKCTKDGDPQRSMTFENLSGAAKAMDIPVEELGKLYAKAAGVPYEEIARVKTQTTFTWKNDALKNGPEWIVETTPKENSRGREAVTPVVKPETDTTEVDAA